MLQKVVNGTVIKNLEIIEQMFALLSYFDIIYMHYHMKWIILTLV